MAVTDPYLLAFDGTPYGTDYAIGIATSLDSVTWTEYSGNPVLTKGAGGQWDQYGVSWPNLLLVGTTYYLFYYGLSSGGGAVAIGVATSSDGINYVRYGGNPIIPVGGGGAWDSVSTAFSEVVYDPNDPNPNARWKMWYQGGNGSTVSNGYATAPDPFTWTKYAGNPISFGGTPPMFYKGVWYFFSSNGTEMSVATSGSPTGPLGPSINLLAASTASQLLTASTSIGSNVFQVADTSLFHPNEPVMINSAVAGGSAIQDTRVLSIPDGTHIHTVDNAIYNFTTSCSIVSLYTGTVTGGVAFNSPILNINGTWVAYGTAYGQFSTGPGCERSVAATSSSSLTSGWSWDYTRGAYLPLGSSPTTSWNGVSSENPWAMIRPQPAGGLVLR